MKADLMNDKFGMISSCLLVKARYRKYAIYLTRILRGTFLSYIVIIQDNQCCVSSKLYKINQFLDRFFGTSSSYCNKINLRSLGKTLWTNNMKINQVYVS